MSKFSYPSVLLMESHGLAPNVRSTSFSSVKVWSKLYQAGPFFVDLTLGPGDGNLSLRGEVLTTNDTPPPAEAEVKLFNEQGECAVTKLGDGGFMLPLETTGLYRLVVSN